MPMECVTQREVCAHCIQLPEVVSVVESRGQHLKTVTATSVAHLFCSTPVKQSIKACQERKSTKKKGTERRQ